MPDITENNITANLSLKTQAAVGNEFSNIPLIVDGSAVVTHALLERSGIPGKFGSGSDHTHFEHNNFHASLKQNSVIYMFRGHGNPNSVSLAGRSDFMGKADYTGAEDSIDTTATIQNPVAPDYKASVKLRYTDNVALAVNTLVILQISSAVAGIQAAFFSGKVTQAPTLVSGIGTGSIEAIPPPRTPNGC
jgi:hypothetical protein